MIISRGDTSVCIFLGDVIPKEPELPVWSRFEQYRTMLYCTRRLRITRISGYQVVESGLEKFVW